MTISTARTNAPATSPHQTPRRRVVNLDCDSPSLSDTGCSLISVGLTDGQMQRQPIERGLRLRVRSRRAKGDDLPLAIHDGLGGDRQALRSAWIDSKVDANRSDR